MVVIPTSPTNISEAAQTGAGSFQEASHHSLTSP